MRTAPLPGGGGARRRHDVRRGPRQRSHVGGRRQPGSGERIGTERRGGDWRKSSPAGGAALGGGAGGARRSRRGSRPAWRARIARRRRQRWRRTRLRVSGENGRRPGRRDTVSRWGGECRHGRRGAYCCRVSFRRGSSARRAGGRATG